MTYLLVTIHAVVCFFLIIVVLLQSGKAADLAGAFGGMGSQTAFGPRGAATVLSKATTISAVVFMLTSIVLSIVATRQGGVGHSVLGTQRTTKPSPAQTAPLAPTSPAPGPGGMPMTNVEVLPPGANVGKDGKVIPPPPAEHAPAPGHSPAPAHSPAGHSAPAEKK
jgi:preprotein translocase subunit SecG